MEPLLQWTEAFFAGLGALGVALLIPWLMQLGYLAYITQPPKPSGMHQDQGDLADLLPSGDPSRHNDEPKVWNSTG